MRVIIARHAETHKNKEMILQGSGAGKGSPLTNRGARQSIELCDHLSKVFNISSVISSPARRTLETVQPIKKRVKNFSTDLNLREIDCGSWEGKEISTLESDYKSEWSKWKNEPLDFTFPDGEALSDVHKRTNDFFMGLLNSKIEGDILLVSHSATISTLIANVMKVDLCEAWESRLGYHKNAHYSVFKLNEVGEVLESSLNSGSHLTNV